MTLHVGCSGHVPERTLRVRWTHRCPQGVHEEVLSHLNGVVCPESLASGALWFGRPAPDDGYRVVSLIVLSLA